MSKTSDQITEYLSVGGLFNPEVMNQTQHEAVRYTLINARDDIQQLERENAALKEALDAQMKYQRELRADRDRLDWLLSHKGRNWVFRTLERGEWIESMGDVRGFVDAAMGVKQ